MDIKWLPMSYANWHFCAVAIDGHCNVPHLKQIWEGSTAEWASVIFCIQVAALPVLQVCQWWRSPCQHWSQCSPFHHCLLAKLMEIRWSWLVITFCVPQQLHLWANCEVEHTWRWRPTRTGITRTLFPIFAAKCEVEVIGLTSELVLNDAY